VNVCGTEPTPVPLRIRMKRNTGRAPEYTFQKPQRHRCNPRMMTKVASYIGSSCINLRRER
jgi:hypothetical protein